MRNVMQLSPEEVVEGHSSSLTDGLSTAAVASLRRIHGLNKLEGEVKEHIMIRFISQFKDPLIALLLASAVLSVLVGQYEDAMSIAAAVIIVGSVAFYQEYQSEQSLEALNDLVPPRCNAIRGGITSNILAEDLVPGDVIQLMSGDRVPADCRVLMCTGLSLDESSLTGEQQPREKCGKALPDVGVDADISERGNMVFTSSLVSSGHGLCLVTSIGLLTEFGKTFQEMKDIEQRKSPLQVKMDELGKKLSIVSFAIIACIMAIGIFQGKSFLSMFNIGVSLAVAAIPEGLPICVTVTLALGVMRMAKKNAIIKKLPAVEALGCATYICCDKTGTLTQNKMTAIRAFCPGMEDEVLLISEGGHLDDKVLSTEVEKKKSFKTPTLSSKSSFSRVENPYIVWQASYNGNVIEASRFACLYQLFDCATLCNNARFSGGEVTGQPTEGALLLASHRLGVHDRRLTVKRLEETGFSSESKCMEVRCRESNKDVIYMKGALEVIILLCSNYIGLKGENIPMSPNATDRIQHHASGMGRDGLRVIAMACGSVKGELTLCGIVGLKDPLREGVVEAIHRMQDSGAKVMMITGDSEITAISIAKQSGIYEEGVNKRILSGQDIEEIVNGGGEGLASIIEDVAVCYRTSPRHKLYIVRALQHRGHVVGMTGDGVNDAPALKAADIGIAVGSGTDVAKEAAAMVILDDDFSTIMHAVEEGKSIFYNIKNFLTFQLSTSVAALSLVALNNLIGRPNPLNPMQILWINIIMDGPLAQSLGVETVDPQVMRRPPRKRQDDIITKPLVMRVLSSGVLILIGTVCVFLFEMEDGVVSSRDRTMTFTTFVMFDMFNALACRHNNRPVFELSWNSNKAFLLAMAFSLLGQTAVLYFPPLQKVFRTVSLSFTDLIFVTFLTSSMLVLDTVRKEYFPSIFTEVLSSDSFRSDKGKVKTDDKSFMV